jgi:Ca2+-binding EF-hand superfamily protein
MGVSEKKEAAPITALRPELDERDVKPGKIIDPKEVAAARADLDKAKKSGAGYREVNAAARRVARAESGGDLKKEDRKEEMIRNTASAERLVVLDKPIESATAITEATSRNAMDKLHESGVAGYLKRGLLPKELVRYFDLNGDGKVEFREFDRVRRDGADMSYQQVAALDGKKGWFDARTITEEEFLKAARAMASLSAITSQEMGRITAQNKNNRLINQNGDGEITINEIRVALNRAGMTVQSSDTNHNGKLEGAEVDLALLKVELGSRLQKGKDINPAMDRDGNGHVSMGEAIAGLKSKGITRADQIDTDGEFRAAMASPAAAKPVVGKPGHTKK